MQSINGNSILEFPKGFKKQFVQRVVKLSRGSQSGAKHTIIEKKLKDGSYAERIVPLE